tara:strand:- start:754 stop:1038 length:285 start_codon:yes stop_codon:yes gene_type:complete
MHYLTQDFEIMKTPEHVLKQMNGKAYFKNIKVCVWGQKSKDKKIKEIPKTEFDQKFDPEATVKELKSIILNFTDNKPFLLRFNIDNYCKISQLL